MKSLNTKWCGYIKKDSDAFFLHRNRQGKFLSLIVLIGLLFLVAVFSSTLGSAPISFFTTFKIIFSKLPFVHSHSPWPQSFKTIVIDVRLPRILLAGFVGAALAIAGATYQGIFRNPLADPYLIGVAQGAALGATIGFILPFGLEGVEMGTIPIFAFIGGLTAAGIVYRLAKVGKTVPVSTLILAGVALGAFLSAINSYLMLMSKEELHGIFVWLLGAFSLTDWEEVWIVLPCVLAGMVGIFLYARPLNIMMLDEEQAQQLGVDVEKVKVILLALATFITAAAVCFVGIIGFVGIIIPHAVRLIWGADHRFLLPLSMLVGSIFLILADTLAHTILPFEIPVGIVTAFCGAPFFLYLLRRRRVPAL